MNKKMIITVITCLSLSILPYAMESDVEPNKPQKKAAPHQLNAMVSSMRPYLQILCKLAQQGWLLPEIIAHIYNNLISLPYSKDDLIRLHHTEIEKLSQELIVIKENRDNPKEVLLLIKKLHAIYGPSSISALILETGLKQAKFSLGDITSWQGENCLHLLCNGTYSHSQYLDYIKIILGTDENKNTARDLINKTDWLSGQSALREAWRKDNKDILKIFYDWAHTNNIALKKPTPYPDKRQYVKYWH